MILLIKITIILLFLSINVDFFLKRDCSPPYHFNNHLKFLGHSDNRLRLQTEQSLPPDESNLKNSLIISKPISSKKKLRQKSTENIEKNLENKDFPSMGFHYVLPDVPYNHEALLDIVNEIPMDVERKKQVILYLTGVEKKVFEIKHYQSKQHLEHFYQPMKSAILEIRNTVNTLNELTRPYHETLSNSLGKLILQWTTPLEMEINKRLEISDADRKALEFKTKQLYAEQGFIIRQGVLQKVLMEHLTKLKQLLTEPGKPLPRCYISYAWPSKENKEQEYWVQPFLSILYDHLTASGIRVIMDIRDNKPGDSIYQFMKQYHEGNYIILVGTESLLQKHYSETVHAVQTELSIINNRFERDQMQFGQSRIYPMLISGTLKTAYPEIYDKYRTVRDTREQGYIGTLKKLIDWVYESRIAHFQMQYENLWRLFYQDYSGLSKNSSIIEQEIAIGYHHQHLDFLKQDLQYQTVQAQEETKHSQAVTAEMIGVLMKSQGTNPSIFYEGYAQQFQRPSGNPDFIERQELWKKMTQHFNQSDQQILILTTHGLGGMGKTELAKYYYLHPPKPYALRAWFYAESREQLYSQYVDLAKANGVEFLKGMPIQEQVRRVKDWLESQKDCLLVYDNVPSAKQIEGLLPEQGKHHILITSRNKVDWHVDQKLNVDVMTEEEAIALIRKITGYQQDELILKELVKTLGYLPLALAQAGAYMAEKQTSVEDYLMLYKQYQSTLMQDETLKKNPKHEPVWITFDLNFTALEVDCPAALTTLKQASWLDPSMIPEVLLKIMVKNVKNKPKELLWADVKKHIARYSLMHIDPEGHKLTMHRLLQDIVRNKQNKSEIKKNLNLISLSIKTIYPQNNKTIENIGLVKLLLPHAESVLSHIKTFFKGVRYDNFHLFFLLGDAYETIGSFIKAKENFGYGLKIKQKKYGSDQIEIADILYRIGKIDIELGNYEGSKQLLEKSLKVKEKKLGVNHIEVAKILDRLGWAYLYLGHYVTAKPLLERALFIEKKYCPTCVETANTLVNLGWNYNLLGECTKAEPVLSLALKIYEDHFGHDHIEVAKALNALGKTYIYLGKYADAKDFSKRALDIRKKYYGLNHVLTINTLISFGWLNLLLGNYQEAKDSFEYGLSVFEEYYNGSHLETAYAVNNLGSSYFSLGDLNKSRELHEKALAMYKDHLPHEHIDVTNTLNNLGIVFLNLREYEKSKTLFEEILITVTKIYGKDHIFTATAMANLGNIYRLLGDCLEGEKLLENALKLLQDYYGTPDHVDIARVTGNLALLYGELGNSVRKKEYFERVLGVLKKHLYENHLDIIKTSKELEKLNFQDSEICKADCSKSSGYSIIFHFH